MMEHLRLWLLAYEQAYLASVISGCVGTDLLVLGCCDLMADQAGLNIPNHHYMVDHPSNAKRNSTLVGAYEALPFQAKSLDLVILYHVLESSSRADKILSELERVLKPGGSVVVLGLNGWRRTARQIARHHNKQGGRRNKPYFHPSQTVSQLCKKNGLIVESIRHYGYWPTIAFKKIDPLALVLGSLLPWLFVGYLCFAKKQTYWMTWQGNSNSGLLFDLQKGIIKPSMRMKGVIMNQLTEIFTDGACRGNPGPGGWGVLLRCGQKESQLYGASKDTTNNRMELQAAIEGLKALKRPSQVKLTTDSKYVKDGITKWIHNWKSRNWKTSTKQAVKNVDLWQQLDQLCQTHQVQWAWVKGHSGHRENEIVDQLANRAIDENS